MDTKDLNDFDDFADSVELKSIDSIDFYSTYYDSEYIKNNPIRYLTDVFSVGYNFNFIKQTTIYPEFKYLLKNKVYTIKVSSQQAKVVAVNTQGISEVVSIGIQGPPGPTSTINTADDVDVSDLRDGSVLVYSMSVSKWEATTKLQKQELEGGQF